MGRTAAGTVRVQQRRLWSPVRTAAADSYWILLIVALALTVIITRVSLELTGYPQVGDATYHVAHVLWGGLVMFIALVLPLTFANPYVPWVTAMLGGIGAGLFIDEVGKFITQRNDYFFPLAFPIIYSFILVCVWFALRLRAFRRPDTRSQLYHVLEDVKQVLDNDLDPHEHAELRSRLTHVLRETDDVEERVLAEALLSFCQSRTIRLAENPTILQQTWHRGRAIAFRLPPRIIARSILVICFGYTALSSVVQLVTFASLFLVRGPRRVPAGVRPERDRERQGGVRRRQPDPLLDPGVRDHRRRAAGARRGAPAAEWARQGRAATRHRLARRLAPPRQSPLVLLQPALRPALGAR